MALTDNDVAVLELAGRTLPEGDMLNAIRDLGFSEVYFYRKLNWLIDQEMTLAAYPVLVNRLRRLRESRSAARRP